MWAVCIHGSPDRMGKLYLFNASGTGHGLACLSCMIRGRPRVVCDYPFGHRTRRCTSSVMKRLDCMIRG